MEEIPTYIEEYLMLLRKSRSDNSQETLEETLVEFKLVDGKYKMENIELKLLGM